MTADANLECIKKKCSESPTDGEVTQKQNVLFRRFHSIVAFLFDAFKVKPKARLSVADNYLGLHNLETD